MPLGRLHYGIAGEDGNNLLGFVPFLNSPADSRNPNDRANGIAKVQAMLDHSGFLQMPFKALKYQIETKEFDEDGTYKVKESFCIVIKPEQLDQEGRSSARRRRTSATGWGS